MCILFQSRHISIREVDSLPQNDPDLGDSNIPMPTPPDGFLPPRGPVPSFDNPPPLPDRFPVSEPNDIEPDAPPRRPLIEIPTNPIPGFVPPTQPGIELPLAEETIIDGTDETIPEEAEETTTDVAEETIVGEAEETLVDDAQETTLDEAGPTNPDSTQIDETPSDPETVGEKEVMPQQLRLTLVDNGMVSGFSFGTPPQAVDLFLDTGSSSVVVTSLSPLCSVYPSINMTDATECPGDYDVSLSTTSSIIDDTLKNLDYDPVMCTCAQILSLEPTDGWSDKAGESMTTCKASDSEDAIVDCPLLGKMVQDEVFAESSSLGLKEIYMLTQIPSESAPMDSTIGLNKDYWNGMENVDNFTIYLDTTTNEGFMYINDVDDNLASQDFTEAASPNDAILAANPAASPTEVKDENWSLNVRGVSLVFENRTGISLGTLGAEESQFIDEGNAFSNYGVVDTGSTGVGIPNSFFGDFEIDEMTLSTLTRIVLEIEGVEDHAPVLLQIPMTAIDRFGTFASTHWVLGVAVWENHAVQFNTKKGTVAFAN
eukprot:Awhi_evm1s4852